MSSIIYVADEEMLEYHRISCQKDILFWRLESKRNMRDFHHGDFIFFYARPFRPYKTKKKAIVGYAHYDKTIRLSLNQMWNQYGQRTGYDTKEKLREAIEKAGNGVIPEKMRCFVLHETIFFHAPIFPSDIGINIPVNWKVINI